MGKKKHGKRLAGKPTQADDDNAVDDADPNQEDFFYDEIDKFHANKEKILLGDDGPDDDSEVESEEEEVLGIASDDEDSDDDQDASEVENDDKGIVSGKAWGKKKSLFYGGDTLDGLEGSDREDAEREEEEEVLAIQKRLAEQMDEDDYGLELLQATSEAKAFPEKDALKSQITADFSALSKKAQWRLAKKQSPELEGLIQDFKAKISELENELSPLMKMVKSGQIPKGYGSDYINLKYRVYLAYLLNISFYLMLKTNKTPVQNHPVISRLVQYRTVINQLAPINIKLRPEIDELLLQCKNTNNVGHNGNNVSERKTAGKTRRTIFETVEKGQDSDSSMEIEPKVVKSERKQAKKRPKALEESFEETEFQQFSKSMNERLLEEENNAKQKPEEDEEKDDVDDRRAINYKIAKNKGIKQKRRKIDRNPRVKMRQKYRKAKIRRKGQVREYKPEIRKYAGEASGIRVGLTKSITLQ